MRKKYILSLENRTPDQIAEEEALYVEVKRLEHTERKFKKDRENLLRTLAGIDSGLPDIVEDDISVLGLSSESTSNIGGNKKKSQRKSGLAMDADSPATPSVASTPVIKRPQNLKNAAYGEAFRVFKVYFSNCFHRCPTLHYSHRCSTFRNRNESCSPTCISPYI
jgi:DNA methyltransferase 1-associated protein 1